jgi:hypothetical protein
VVEAIFNQDLVEDSSAESVPFDPLVITLVTALIFSFGALFTVSMMFLMEDRKINRRNDG